MLLIPFLLLSMLTALLVVQAIIDGMQGNKYTAKALLAGLSLGIMVTLFYYL